MKKNVTKEIFVGIKKWEQSYQNKVKACVTAHADHHHCCPWNCVWGSVLNAAWGSWEKAGKNQWWVVLSQQWHQKAHWKFATDCGGHAIVLVEITALRHRAGPYCLKEDPLQMPVQLKTALSFFTVVGWASVPATLHAQSASLILHKTKTSLLLLGKINSQWKIVPVIWNLEVAM